MASLTALYSRALNPLAWTIRLASWWGPWSHCALVDGDHVIESRAIDGGVVRTPLEVAIGRATAHELVDIDVPDPQSGIEWARSTLGAGYDWAGLLAIPLREKQWQSKTRWYCSEHLEAAICMAGRERFRAGLHGVTPCQSYFVR